MAKLKLQAEVISALEGAELQDFSTAQRAVVSTLKSGQNKWLIGADLAPLRIAVAATHNSSTQGKFRRCSTRFNPGAEL